MSFISKKICLLGDFGVGKTSLIKRFIEVVFSEKYLVTIGIQISRKLICPEFSSQKLDLIIWDIEGHTKFKSIAPNYLKGATGAIIVGDLSRPETLDNLSAHINLFIKFNPKAVVIVALNKSDLVKEEKIVKLRELNNFQDNYQVIKTIITSAKEKTNVAQVFHVLAQSMIKNHY
ncbi:MAG: Rab family GTPase [Xenococcaceae cyanobacterium MO_207.B15]|nr:Rab family GTPase [Xenococcaceae cyanobacterium MO_207.B15]